MQNSIFNKRTLIKYLLWVFLISWTLQVGVAMLYHRGLQNIGQLVLLVVMYVPMLSVFLSGESISHMGWELQFKGKIKHILIAWFSPAILTTIGAILYFAIFPKYFDLTGEYIVSIAGPEVMNQLYEQGLTYPIYILISIISTITYAPLINMVAALGEEVGWRGFMYPQLKTKFGTRKGVLIGGIIWGIWHWPLIWLIGYEYGTNYVGFPISGMLLFCIIIVALGIITDWLYEKSNSILIPSIFHGSINAAATIPLALCKASVGSTILLGPAPIGILAGLPMIMFAIALLFRVTNNKELYKKEIKIKKRRER